MTIPRPKKPTRAVASLKGPVPTVFYSWQSDLPVDESRNFIGSALKAAAKALAGADGGVLEVDRDTKGVPGSPSIQETIFKKIDRCEVYVADVSIINPILTPAGARPPRPTPNPNVLVELGYAIARLGWDRVILVFNTATGKFPDDLPFDVRHRRITDYHTQGDAPWAAERKRLQLDLTDELKKALASPPIHRTRRLGTTNAAVVSGEEKRERDVQMLWQLLTTLDTVEMDTFLALIRDEKIHDNLEDRLLRFVDVAEGAHFHLFDTILARYVGEFVRAWRTIVSSFTDIFHAHHRLPYAAVHHSHYWNRENDRQLRRYRAAAKELHAAYKAVTDRIKNRFPEIELAQTSAAARASNAAADAAADAAVRNFRS